MSMGVYTWYRKVGVVAVVLILSSCVDNTALFSSLDEEPVPALEAITAGAIISPTEPLSVQITYPDEEMSRATALSVELRTLQGEDIGSLSFTEEQLLEPELPTIELPQPSLGPYLLFVEAFRGDELLFTEERQIFVTSTPPVIESVSVYPSTVGSDETAVAVAEVRSTIETRPFLRWTFFDELVGEGYLDAGIDRVTFDVDGRVGVHQMKVELFPWGPDEGVDLSVGTAITATTDVFIRDRVRETAAESNVLVRYRFDGTYVPDTDRIDGEFRPIQRSDGVTLDVRDERLGVALASGETLIVPYDAIPAAQGAYRLTIALVGDNAAEGLTVAVGGTSRPVVQVAFGKETTVVERDSGVADELPLTNASVVAADSQDARVSIVFATVDGVVYAIPDTIGSRGDVVEVGPIKAGVDETRALTVDGAGEALIDEITFARLDGFNTAFEPGFSRFVYGDDAERIYRFSIEDVDRERVSLMVPDDRFVVFSDASRSESFLLWRERGVVTVSELANGANGMPPIREIDPNRYPELVSGRWEQPKLSVRFGGEAAVNDEGEVVLPGSLGRPVLVRIGTTSRDASPFAIGTYPF